ncbi:unnamed protein product [Malus baccata var. baccata]
MHPQLSLAGQGQGPAEEEVGDDGGRGVGVGVEPVDDGVVEVGEGVDNGEIAAGANILDVLDTGSFTNSSKSFEELPPPPTAANAFSLSSFALTFTGVSPVIASAIAFPNSAGSGTASSPSHTFTATPMSSTNSLAFTNWSASMGHPNTNTPATIASSTEFHPQWLTNPPTARWPKINTCGAQPFMTRPLPPTFSSNPSGTTPIPSSTCWAVPLFTAHTKRTLLSSSPEAKASICCLLGNF